MEIGVEGIAQVSEDGPTLLGQRRDGRPDSFVPLAAPLAAGALRDPAVDDHETNRLLGQVIGFFRLFRGYAFP